MWFFSGLRMLMLIVVTVFLQSVAHGSEPTPDIIDISTPPELLQVLAKAKGGETLRLAPGQYGELRLRENVGPFTSPVTIVSADANRRAVFNAVNLQGVSNLNFVDLTFDYVAKYAASLSGSPFKVMASANITFQNVVFDGDLAKGVNAVEDGYGTGRGLILGNSNSITVQNCLFRNWHRAAAFGTTRNLKLLGNEVVSSSSDGFNFTQVQDVLIDGNHFHDFNRAPGSSAHPDMIQFWTTSSKPNPLPTKNVIIINNILDIGAGSSAQAIFMRNERVDKGLSGFELFYRNIVISNNVIATRHQNGIIVGEADGVVIDRNTMIQKAGAKSDKEIPVPTIGVSKNAVNVKVTNNISSGINISFAVMSNPPKGWAVKNNKVVQAKNKNLPGFVSSILVNPLVSTTASRADFMVIPGHSIEGQHIGATLDNAALPAP